MSTLLRVWNGLYFRWSNFAHWITWRSYRDRSLQSFVQSRIGSAFSRGAATSALRRTNPTDPISWEFSAFSQNGEDGLLDYLVRMLAKSDRYFVEIGSSDGLENNCSWLAFGLKFNGLMIEGNAKKSKQAQWALQSLNWGVQYKTAFVTVENTEKLMTHSLYSSPDVFSIDMDGNDYYVAKRILEIGFRPKIFCMEYNSAFGPEAAITIPYDPLFDYNRAHPTHLYYGVSLRGLINLMTPYGYRFVTVDSKGVNAFFIRPEAFPAFFSETLRGLEFAENFAQRARWGTEWSKQFALINTMSYVEI